MVLLIPYLALAIAILFAIIQINKANTQYESVNGYWLESIPSLFTTIGVFGTFLGIVIGLQDFKTDDIDRSIPLLLDGLKVSFWSSIIGIVLSIISSKIIESIHFKNEIGTGQAATELDALNSLATKMDGLIASISGDNEDSLATQIMKMRTSMRDNLEEMLSQSKVQSNSLEAVRQGIVGDGETSLLTQVQKMRDEQLTIAKETWVNVSDINKSVKENGALMVEKFDEFSKLLEQSNTEALVKAIENVIGGFNDRLNELIERLVKENFEELNTSVNRLNEWQKENKDQVERLISQYKEVSDDIKISSTSLKDITKSTEKLVSDGGRLETMIKELEEVISEENKLKASIESLNDVTTVFENAANKLNEWMNDQKQFSEKVEGLIDGLKEIEELRNQTDGFFSDIKDQLQESVGIVSEGNEELMKQVEALEDSFNQRMNASFESLDKVLQAMVMGFADRMNGKQ